LDFNTKGEPMNASQLRSNVEAYEPEVDTTSIDLEALEARQWPPNLVECVRQQRFSSPVLRRFEQQNREWRGKYE
jgi:hypothetical protein